MQFRKAPVGENIGPGAILMPASRACLMTLITESASSSGTSSLTSDTTPPTVVATYPAQNDHDVAVAPGCFSPTEIFEAWEAGADFVKVFPCSAMGGASYLKSLKAPFPYLRLVPTGGVTLENAVEYLALPNVPVVGGTWIANAQAIRDKDWSGILARAKQAFKLRETR